MNMPDLGRTEDLQKCLEWAGIVLLSLGGKSPLPAKIRTLWPDYVPDASVAYGYSGERLRPSKVSGKDIELMDELLVLPKFVTNVTARRIVQARTLVTPISNRYLYSWTKIAYMLHIDRRKAIRMHHEGLRDIVRHIGIDKVDTFRKRLDALSQ